MNCRRREVICRTVIACAAIAGSACTGFGVANAPGSTEGQGTSESNGKPHLAAKGTALRTKIDERYESQKSAGRLLIENGSGGNDIVDIVLSEIPLGSSYPDAIEICQAAGFAIGRRALDATRKGAVSMQLNKIDPYKQMLMSKTVVYIMLYPTSAEDWSTVKDVVATISHHFP